MCRFILPLSKIAYQVWRDHPFNQKKERNFIQQKISFNRKKQKGWVGEVGQNLKEGVGNIGWVIIK